MSKFSHPQLTSQAQTDLDLVCWGSIPHWSTLQRYVYSTAGICNAWWRLFSDPLLPFGTGTWCLTPILMRSRSLSLFVNMCHLVFMCHMSSANWRAMLIFPSMTYSSYTTGRACVGVENTITLLINQRYPHTLTYIWVSWVKAKGLSKIHASKLCLRAGWSRKKTKAVHVSMDSSMKRIRRQLWRSGDSLTGESGCLSSS